MSEVKPRPLLRMLGNCLLCGGMIGGPIGMFHGELRTSEFSPKSPTPNAAKYHEAQNEFAWGAVIGLPSTALVLVLTAISTFRRKDQLNNSKPAL